MRANDFIKEDHGFLAPGSHDWEGKVGNNILKYLKNLPSGAWAGFKNITGIGSDDHDHETPDIPPSANLAKPKVTSKKPGLRTSDRTTRQGRTSRIGGEDDQ